jgi:hypothetical protein
VKALGLIAGEGRLPPLLARGMTAAGARVCGVGLRGHYDASLPALCDRFEVAGVYRIGRWIAILRRFGASEAVLAGRVAKVRMHDPLRVLRQLPDWRAARLWYRRLRRDRRTGAILTSLAEELGGCGIRLLDGREFARDNLPVEGVLAVPAAVARHGPDVGAGWPVLQRVAGLGVGQAMAVCGGRVVAVEALEGTDGLIERAGHLCAGRAWALLKGAAPGHDMRADIPTVGPGTIERLARAAAGCVALAAGRVIMIDKPQVLAAAERAGIGIVGVA